MTDRLVPRFFENVLITNLVPIVEGHEAETLLNYRSLGGTHENLIQPDSRSATAQFEPARLQRWLNYGHFKTTYRALPGDVEARLLTEEEMQRLQVVIDLINSGVPVQKAFAQVSMDQSQRTEN